MKAVKKLGSDKSQEFYAIKNYGDASVMTHGTEQYSPEMKFAIVCAEKWGMVAGMPDGEDSSGQMKLRLSTPEELVGRAYEIARRVFAKGRELGQTTPIPSYEEIQSFFPKDSK